MPIPALAVGALVQGGSNLLSAGLDAWQTGVQNRKSRDFQREMYQRQLVDNRRLWEDQNQYNSPQAQMKRLQEAGLNPNLVYGSGSAQQPASSIQSPDVQSPQYKTPDFSGIAAAGNIFSQYLDYEIKAAQVDNLKADNTVKLEQAGLIRAQTANTTGNTLNTEFELNQKRSLSDIYSEYKREELRKLKTDIDTGISDREIRLIQNYTSLTQQAEAILNSRAQRANTEAELQRIKAATREINKNNELKQLEIEMRRNGINPNDPMWARMLQIALQKMLGQTNLFNTMDAFNPFKKR